MKTVIKNFHQTHPRSIITLKMINDYFHECKKNKSITFFRCFLYINKGHDHLLLVDDGKNDDDHGGETKNI